MKKERLYIPVPEKLDVRNIKKLHEVMEANNKELEACDHEAKKAGRLVGRSFSISVADGIAVYQVKENKRTVRVNYCEGLCTDDYQDFMLGSGATISKAKARQIIRIKDIVFIPKMNLHIKGVMNEKTRK